jgi:hypothetical protein
MSYSTGTKCKILHIRWTSQKLVELKFSTNITSFIIKLCGKFQIPSHYLHIQACEIIRDRRKVVVFVGFWHAIP